MHLIRSIYIPGATQALPVTESKMVAHTLANLKCMIFYPHTIYILETFLHFKLLFGHKAKPSSIAQLLSHNIYSNWMGFLWFWAGPHTSPVLYHKILATYMHTGISVNSVNRPLLLERINNSPLRLFPCTLIFNSHCPRASFKSMVKWPNLQHAWTNRYY